MYKGKNIKSGKNDKALYSHDDYVAQLFMKVLYAAKNLRRRSILEAFDKQEVLSDRDIQQYLRGKGLVKNSREYSISRIREYHVVPLIEAEMLKEQEDSLFQITSFGNDIKEAIIKVKEFESLPIPTHQELYLERILLELREGKKTYSELKLKLDLPIPRGVIKRLKDAVLIRVNHPYNSLHVSSLSRFTISLYYPFIQGIRDFIEKTGRSWFTEYSIIHHLTLKWKEKFGKPLDIEEAHRLIEKGIETGDILKSNGSYKLSIKISIETLTPPQRRILGLIKEGYDYDLTMAQKSGLHWSSIYKVLKRLAEKKLVEKHKEYVTVELTEKGKRLADCLFEIKRCVIDYISSQVADPEERVKSEGKNENKTKFVKSPLNF